MHNDEAVWYILYVGICNLDEVVQFVKARNVDWKRLGVELGLSYPTLAQIEVEHQGNVTLCTRMMLEACLLQRGNVSRSGALSWSVLKSALENTGEKSISGEIPVFTTIISLICKGLGG